MVHLESPTTVYHSGIKVRNIENLGETVISPVHTHEVNHGTFVPEYETPGSYGWGFWHWVISLIIFAVIIGLIIWVIVVNTRSGDEDQKGMNEICEKNSQCNTGLVCSNNKCKIQIGGRCNADDDCTA